MERNIKLVKGHRLLGLFYLLLPTPLLVYMFSDGVKTETLVIVFGFFGFFSAIHFLAALGARDGKKWGRVMSRVIGAFLLLGFPIGTAFAIYFFICTGSMWESNGNAQTVS